MLKKLCNPLDFDRCGMKNSCLMLLMMMNLMMNMTTTTKKTPTAKPTKTQTKTRTTKKEKLNKIKSCIRETLNLSTDADSSNNAMFFLIF